MSWFRQTGLAWIAAGFLVILTGQIMLVRNQNLGPDIALQDEAQRLTRTLAEARKVINEQAPELTGIPGMDSGNRAIKTLRKENIETFLFRQGVPVYWTTNSYNLQPSGKTGVEIQKHYSRYLAVWTIHTDTLDYLFARDLIKNPEFKYLGTNIITEEKSNKFSLAVNPLEHSARIEVDGLPPFYLVIDEFRPGVGFDILVILGLALLSLGLMRYFQSRAVWYLGPLLVLLLWACTEILFFHNKTLWNLKETSLFASEVYASSWYFPNLGVLLFNAVLSAFGTYFLQRWVARYQVNLKLWMRRLLWLISTAILFAYSLFLIQECGHLVTDSTINFDFHEIHLINGFTLLGLLGVILGFGVLFFLLKLQQSLEAGYTRNTRRFLAAIFMLLLLALPVSRGEYFHATLVLLLLGGIYGYELVSQNRRAAVRIALRLLLPCLVVGIVFNRQVNQKEYELREILAAKILLQNEKEPYNLLNKTETQLLQDKGILDYYTCRDESKSMFEKRLRQLYFTEYSEDFEIHVFDYNMEGKGYREENAFDYPTIQSLFASDVCKPLTTHFSVVNERKLKGSYLGRFMVGDGRDWYGVYFVLIKPRMSATQGRLSDVFNKSPLESLFIENQYSYAIYNRNRLYRRFGQYNYPNTSVFTAGPALQSISGFSHFSYSDDLGNVIVISKPKVSFLQALTGFTILGLGSLFVALVYYLFILLQHLVLSVGQGNSSRAKLMRSLRARLPLMNQSDLFLSSKLQLYVTLVVFATFIVVLFVTINYFRSSYGARQREFLWNKTNEIANSISTQANLDALFNKNQNGLIYDLSNYYSTDINIYNADGRLMVSSNDRIYEQDIVGNLMNPAAYADFTGKGISGFIRDEKIGNLQYISAYYTLFDNDLNIKGYLNLPYFSNRKDLYREISNYAVTIINLFALVFALAAIVAYIMAHRITEPLNLIRRQMALVKLGTRNQPIAWQHNDEIGLLIAEYNHMINELEASSNKLAESERQGAWREMAKQVAHEIKNPLTPMKLSLQHLQFAIQRKDENLEEKFRKTSELLINQIDSLSKMAEEFSAFAKMPDARPEPVIVNDVLEQVVTLFGRDASLKVDYSPPASRIEVEADPHHLGRIFTNILKNAAQAIPPDRQGQVKVDTTCDSRRIVIYFRDNGKGIPAELRDKIFSPNFSTKNSGMGLGLAISRKMAEQFGGTIDFTSTEGEGATFFVTLPVNRVL
ncbi:MAG: HAMP domain-containing histidine kinase [Bacteroidetes bacterium]|nr:HAMP domain-containing histidine kinase [Bacteroidota bacterium]